MLFWHIFKGKTLPLQPDIRIHVVPWVLPAGFSELSKGISDLARSLRFPFARHLGYSPAVPFGLFAVLVFWGSGGLSLAIIKSF
jgi:hypothetical protein